MQILLDDFQQVYNSVNGETKLVAYYKKWQIDFTQCLPPLFAKTGVTARWVLDLPDEIILDVLNMDVQKLKEQIKMNQLPLWKQDLDHLVRMMQAESQAILECTNTSNYTELATHAERAKFLAAEITRLSINKGIGLENVESDSSNF